MKIAITADIHLQGSGGDSSRYKGLKNILENLAEDGIDNIIIAGDLFDKDMENYAKFEKITREYGDTSFYIIPGNHDPDIKGEKFSSNNIKPVTGSPKILNFDSTQFVMVPYRPGVAMGEELEKVVGKIKKDRPWVLIGHGDWLGNIDNRNLYEPGIYMPLTDQDRKIYRPDKIFLGHIHKPLSEDDLYYPGSPVPMDITETGKRRYLIVDTKNLRVKSRPVKTDILYFTAELTLLPVEDEESYLKNEIKKVKEEWDLTQVQKEKTEIRVKVSGFTKNKKKITRLVKERFSGFKFYNNREPDTVDLNFAGNSQKSEIAELTVNWMEENLKWNFNKPDSPDKEKVVLDIMKIIYQK